MLSTFLDKLSPVKFLFLFSSFILSTLHFQCCNLYAQHFRIKFAKDKKTQQQEPYF